MSGNKPTEATPIGDQYLVTGVRPVTMRNRLDWQASQPLRGPKRNPDCGQKACDLGLFDEVSQRQIDLVDLLRQEARANSKPKKSASKVV